RDEIVDRRPVDTEIDVVTLDPRVAGEDPQVEAVDLWIRARDPRVRGNVDAGVRRIRVPTGHAGVAESDDRIGVHRQSRGRPLTRERDGGDREHDGDDAAE